ncbi:mandelate racemase/muconate lactonizing enzyme family protein [Paenibacillus sp. GCM10023252]|uniref:mandelate racemase/muconate lactonizing enzyme family protein n=1 Tax=Paenibacillus sp. GCM10023252 TaxID=3252649 RepID=UPI0036208548
MLITNIITYAAQGAVFVEVQTDSGISGFGECSRVGEAVLEELIHQVIKPLVLGQSPFGHAKLEQNVMNGKYKIAGQLLAMAFSGVEIACWDAAARSVGQPVYNLLGGRCREEVKFYGSSMSRHLSAEEEAAKVLSSIEEYGFEAIKMKVGPRLGTGQAVDLEEDVRRVHVMREAIGPRMKLMLDANSSYSYTEAVRFYHFVKEADIYHYEEPCRYDDVQAYVKLAGQLPVPIHVGEQDWNLYTFRSFIASGACQLYAPDVVKCGGIASAVRAAVLCRAFGVTYAPHNTSRGLGLAATLQLAAALPECSYYMEWKIGNDPSEAYLQAPLQLTGGRLNIPSGQGLGVEPDLEKMRRTMRVVD